ncbi:serglycin-like [Carassius auratus]|uniref:Serglycin-like n=1 Tax=Carassius auratus TaxID=7957 RepID=A0A6P6L5I8_CARAU|nr:serglycin-like [Carassius auratus]XP_052427913.1 serglycin-like [Carassius gibelio]
MKFYHRITLALAIICLFGDSGLGVPAKGRVKCNPDDKYSNCVQEMSPLVPLSGQRSQLSPSAAKHIFPVSKEEATPEMEEQSGEGSGNSDAFPPFIGMDQKLTRDARSLKEEVNKNEEEGSTESSGDIDYSEYVIPQKLDLLSKEDLKEENIIA